MAETDIGQTTTTSMKGGVPDFKVQPRTIDEAQIQPETYWYNSKWSEYLGYLKTIPEYRNAARALAIYACGRGWTCPLDKDTAVLERIRGWGEDTIDSILQMMIIVKKTNGDSYAEIIRPEGTLLNLKPLNPARVRHVIDPKGIIIGYDILNGEKDKEKWERMEPAEIFHLSNDRIANEIHGTSVLEACKWVIDWKNEIMSDLRRLMHRSSVRIIYVDFDNASKLSTIRSQWNTAIKDGEVLILPGRKGVDFEVVDYPVPPTAAYLEVLRFVDNYFYEVLGVPKVITGGTQQTTEASSKIGYQTFEQPYITEQRLLEQDIWNQLGIRIEFNRPKSLLDNLAGEQQANQVQTGFQPSEMMPGRNE